MRTYPWRTPSLGIAVLSVVFALAGSAAAQGVGARDVSDRIVLSGDVLVAVPLGEFRNYVSVSPGLAASFLFNLDRERKFGLRLEGSYVIYGRETRHRPLSQTVQLVTVDVTTDNEIVSLAVGPQLTLGSGPVRPYLHAGLGFSYFATTSSVSGSHDFRDFASSTNFDDFTFTWVSGGGLRVRVSRKLALDLGARYLGNGRVRYLREGSIQERPDGSFRFDPVQSETKLLLFQLGVSIPVGAGEGSRFR